MFQRFQISSLQLGNPLALLVGKCSVTAVCKNSNSNKYEGEALPWLCHMDQSDCSIGGG